MAWWNRSKGKIAPPPTVSDQIQAAVPLTAHPFETIRAKVDTDFASKAAADARIRDIEAHLAARARRGEADNSNAASLRVKLARLKAFSAAMAQPASGKES